MRISIIISAILLLTLLVYSQEKPVTQPEFVRMLYGLEADFSQKDAVVEALRRRGIDFVLNDGIRSLARSKGRNDPELRRVLEEADRRRRDPVSSAPPSKKEADLILQKARQNTLAALEEMPDFVVKQQIQRSAAFAGTNNFRTLDRLIVAVSYRATGREEYKVLSINGAIQNNPESKSSYEQVGGTSSTGEFVTVLATIFRPESDTVFKAVDTDLISGHRTVVFDFSIERDKAQQQITSIGYIASSVVTGMRGQIWIDRDQFRVLRIESEATEIPSDFPVSSAKRIIDYDWTAIGDAKYLLPALSDVRLVERGRERAFETRNLIRFKEYQKFGTEVTVVEEDNAPIEQQKP